MSLTTAPFEAPAARPLVAPDALAGREGESVLAIDQIQGNIVPASTRTTRRSSYLHIDDALAFAGWLAGFIRLVATTENVLAFSRLHKSLHRKQGGNYGAVQTVWANIAFSFAGLKKLERSGMDLDGFTDPAFMAGLAARAAALGDPVGSGTSGRPGELADRRAVARGGCPRDPRWR